MSSPHAFYNSLIRKSIDLRALYRDAVAQACEPGLQAVLRENAQALDDIVSDLQQHLRQHGGEPATRGRLGGDAQRQLVEWLLPAQPRRDAAWIRRLARDEADLLQAFERSLASAPADTAAALRQQLPRLQGIHLDMHGLAGAGHC